MFTFLWFVLTKGDSVGPLNVFRDQDLAIHSIQARLLNFSLTSPVWPVHKPVGRFTVISVYRKSYILSKDVRCDILSRKERWFHANIHENFATFPSMSGFVKSAEEIKLKKWKWKKSSTRVLWNSGWHQVYQLRHHNRAAHPWCGSTAMARGSLSSVAIRTFLFLPSPEATEMLLLPESVQ